MSGCNSNQNYFIQNNRSTSRVLNPPGGKSSFSIGGYSDEPEPSRARQQQQPPRNRDTRDHYDSDTRDRDTANRDRHDRDRDRRDHRGGGYRSESPPLAEFESRRREAPAAAAREARHDDDDMDCDIPGLRGHYKSKGGVSRHGESSGRGEDFRQPRGGERGNAREAVNIMKSDVRGAEVQSVRRKSPSTYEYDSSREKPVRGSRAASPKDQSSGELALMQAKRQILERNSKDGKSGSSKGGSYDKPPVAAPRRQPPRDVYENVLSNDSTSSARNDNLRGGRNRNQQPAPASPRKRDRVDNVKLIGGMDRRAGQAPGGNSSLSLGWE